MQNKKIWHYAITATGIVLGLFLFPFLLKVFAPFAAAFFVAALCQKFVKFLENKFHLNRGIISALISTSIVALLILAIVFILFQLYSQAKNLVSALPAAIDSFKSQLGNIIQSFDRYKHSLPSEISSFLETTSISLKDQSQELSRRATSSAFDFAKGFASTLPSAVLFVSMFILATFFFIKDYQLVINFFKELIPKKMLKKLSKLTSFVTHAFSGYLKAQVILMLLTMALVTICLWIIGKENPLLWGLLCGLVDALPVFGTAIILLPWAFASLIYGDTSSFVGLLIVQAIVFLTRQLLEPKIVSHQIGIHPILTLVGVYIGLRYFGIIGVIFAPITMLLLANLYVLYKEKSGS